jgi:hypothetical protein
MGSILTTGFASSLMSILTACSFSGSVDQFDAELHQPGSARLQYMAEIWRSLLSAGTGRCWKCRARAAKTNDSSHSTLIRENSLLNAEEIIRRSILGQ